MLVPVLHLELRNDHDVVQARQRARDVAALLGFDKQDQIRVATATSEIARNAFRYARNGEVLFSIETDPPQRLQVAISDTGEGIPKLIDILDGRYKSETGLGMGILGTKKLMDEFAIETGSQGTIIRFEKHLPYRADGWTQRKARDLAREIQDLKLENPYQEIEKQNQELLKTLQDLRARQEELELLNRELEDTNRGVVALYAELDERADYLRRASELKTKFLSNVSHEFRTPLNSIISLAKLLLERIDGDLTPEQVRQVNYIESSARDLQELVNDLLDLAKVEAGKIRIRPKRFEVHELFSALKGMLKPLLADNTSVDLVFENAADIPPLHTDEGKVSQILRNLVSNAIKFTPKGVVRISAQSEESGLVLFAVADTGIGIAPEHHEAIFKEFSQVENPLQEKFRGTGLGLPLCRDLANLLGGRIWLTSEPGVGSTFFVEVPSAYVGEAFRPEEPSALPAPEFHRMPVLYLEDELESAAVFEGLLRKTEFQPILANSVARAEAWMSKHTPAAIVSDIYLGEEAIWQFIARLRDNFPQIPIIVTSAYSEPLAALKRGANAFLPKPLEAGTLLSELRRLTAQTGTRRILLVDDNEVSRYILREILDLPWLEIEEVSNGADALALLEQAPPDGIILDLLMPDISGLDILKTMRSHPTSEKLPVLVYTSKVLSDSEQKLLEGLNAPVVRKEDVSNRLSPQPFLDWARTSGLLPDFSGKQHDA
jgi:signal transduction histidine kinase/CheY-like chemotaxis protein